MSTNKKYINQIRSLLTDKLVIFKINTKNKRKEETSFFFQFVDNILETY